MNKKLIAPIIVIAIAVIILPTGTAEDLFTSLPLIHFLGAEGFVILVAGVLGLLYFTGMLNKVSTMIHLPPHAFVLAVVVLTVIYIEIISGI